jgi:hypothetical protein
MKIFLEMGGSSLTNISSFISNMGFMGYVRKNKKVYR